MVICGVNQNDEQKNLDPAAGSIRCYRNPPAANFCETLQAHDDRGVIKLRVTHDDNYLISAGMDGTVCLFEIKDKETKGAKLSEGYSRYSNEILITKVEIEDLKQRKEHFNTSLNDDSAQNNNTNMISINNLTDNIQSLQKQLVKNQEDFEKEYNDELRKKKQTEQKRMEEEKSLRQKNEDELRELEHHFNKEYSNESARMDQLKQDHKKDEERWKENLKNIEAGHQLEIQGHHEDYRGRLENSRNQYEGLKRDLEATEREQKEELKVIQEEIAGEFKKLEGAFEIEITA